MRPQAIPARSGCGSVVAGLDRRLVFRVLRLDLLRSRCWARRFLEDLLGRRLAHLGAFRGHSLLLRALGRRAVPGVPAERAAVLLEQTLEPLWFDDLVAASSADPDG